MRVLVVSDDKWHPARVVRDGLEPLSEKRFEFHFLEDSRQWSETRIDDYRVILFAKSNNVSASDESKWMTPEVEQSLRDYVSRGNGLLVVHSGSAGYKETPVIRALMGGVFDDHPKQCPVTVTPRSDHPLTRGVREFTVTDEHYMMEMVDSGVDVFLTSSSEHGEQPAGWTRCEGDGRVCMLTPGHNLEVWLEDSFQRLLENGLEWCGSARRSAFVTGADRGLGFGITETLLADGWLVFAGQYMPDWPELPGLATRYPETLRMVPLDVEQREAVLAAAKAVANHAPFLDMIINNAGVSSPTNRRTIREQPDYDEMLRLYNVNTLGPLRVVEAFLPLLEAGDFRRLCFVSSEAGSVGASRRESWFGYCMSKAALNMAVRNLFNDLRPGGFTFRVYHPGWIRSYMGGEKNMDADLEPLEAGSYAVPFFTGALEDEDRLALTDYTGKEWPW